MAAKNKVENRARRASIPGSIPWPQPRPLPWPGGQGARWSGEGWRAQFGSPARIREWAADELTTGRLLPWFAVAYGAGIVLYSTAEREPVLWAAVVPTALCALGDPSGCIGRLADGTLVSYALSPDAYEEDCARAALVVAVRGDPPPDCKAMVIERAQWRNHGALWLRRNDASRGGAFAIESARAKNFDRPWSPAPPPRETLATTAGEGGETGDRACDATPRQEDIEADQ